MCEYSNWRKLPISAAAIMLLVQAGCGSAENENRNHYSYRPPEIMTMDELALNYEDSIGKSVILEGKLTLEHHGEYVFAGLESKEFRLSLRFMPDNVDDLRMQPCLSGPTLVTGYVEDSHTIRVEYVKLLTDTLVHTANQCYQIFQGGLVEGEISE